MAAPKRSKSDFRDLCTQLGLTVVCGDGAMGKNGQLKQPVKADYEHAFAIYKSNWAWSLAGYKEEDEE